MSGPIWIRWLLTVAFLLVAGYYLRRLSGRPSGADRAVAAAHVLMASGMAVMSSPVGGPLSPASWLTLFLVLGVCAAIRCRGSRRQGDAPHLALTSIAMAYMLAAGDHSAHEMSGPWAVHTPGLALPVVAWVLAACFVLYAVVTANRPASTPRLVMALGMSYMLVMTI
ncbi:MAG: DUF5134 domain-containing protein [Kibdelosporangium sp.]